MHLTDMGYEDMECIELPQDTIQSQDLTHKVMDLWVTYEQVF